MTPWLYAWGGTSTDCVEPGSPCIIPGFLPPGSGGVLLGYMGGPYGSTGMGGYGKGGRPG